LGVGGLYDHLVDLLRQQGFLSLERYMELCLTHPDYGYYRQGSRLGQEGDFITAPEITPMFGELIGLWCAQQWMEKLAPKEAYLVELGPGRGVMMADLRRAIAKAAPQCYKNICFHAVESHRNHRKLLEKQDVIVHENIDWLPQDRPMLIVANEFFDALPVRQVCRRNGAFVKRGLILDPDDRLQWGERRCEQPEETFPWSNDWVEYRPKASQIMYELSRRVTRQGGAMLIIDYGYVRRQSGDTVQAISDHRMVDIFENPGECDLTAHVDFESLSTAAAPLPYQLETQSDFLVRHGLWQRVEQLARAQPDRTIDLYASARRLTHPDAMGQLFKVMQINAT